MVKIEDLKRDANIQLSDLPESFTGILLSEETKEDSRRNMCLYLTIAIETEKLSGSFTQKFGRGHYNLLVKALQNINVTSTDDIMNKRVTWEKSGFKIMDSFPRWLPITVLED